MVRGTHDKLLLLSNSVTLTPKTMVHNKITAQLTVCTGCPRASMKIMLALDDGGSQYLSPEDTVVLACLQSVRYKPLTLPVYHKT
jgi:hypothetical protein